MPLTDVRHYIRNSDGENVTVIYLTNGNERDFWPGSVSNDLARITMTALKESY